MRRVVVFAGAVALAGMMCVAASAQTGYKAPRTSSGTADISGAWTNASITRLERDAKFGDRRAYTRDEAAEIEKTTDERNARLRAPTDQTLIATWASRTGPDTADECQSGSRGAACGYNAGWTEPGDRIARVNGEPRTSYITFPANGRLPAPVAGAASRAGAQAGGDDEEGSESAARPSGARGGRGGAAGARPSQTDNPEGRSLGERCILSFGSTSAPVMQPALYNNNYQIVQTKDHVVILVEMVHDARIIRIGGKHRTDGVRPWLGDSIGWWDGDTLVVETINYHPKQNFRGASDQLKVTERFTRVAADRLLYQFKVEDPQTWAQPWGGEYEFGRGQGVYEYACHEGNYGLEGILAGAREEERTAAAAPPRSASR